MKIAGGLKQDGIVVGNAYDKYGARNPVVRLIMKGFGKAVVSLVRSAAPETIHEIGCGEGYWISGWNREGYEARGTDFSSKVIEIARANAIEQGLSPEIFQTRSLYDLDPVIDRADLVVCCEVLEHLEYPEQGLAALSRIAGPYAIISVPREPLWRFLNMARGRYLAGFGNTPGHVRHWSKAQFVRLVEKYFQVLEVRTPLPWTMILGQSRQPGPNVS